MRMVAKYGHGMGMDSIGAGALSDRLEAKRDDLVALTQELVRIPTVNPPGENYRDICEFLARRLDRSGFTATIERAAGAPGDSDRHPRWNVIARREGASPGQCVHFNSHIDVVEVGRGWTFDPFGGRTRRREGLRARILRHEGRAGGLDHRGGSFR